MTIKGHGIDVVEIGRIAKVMAENDDLIEGWFTTAEIIYLNQRQMKPEVICGRIAAKEAAAKSLGTGFSGDVSWQDVEVQTLPTGAPQIVLSGGALAVAQSRGIAELLVSISHTALTAVASVIAIGA